MGSIVNVFMCVVKLFPKTFYSLILDVSYGLSLDLNLILGNVSLPYAEAPGVRWFEAHSCPVCHLLHLVLNLDSVVTVMSSMKTLHGRCLVLSSVLGPLHWISPAFMIIFMAATTKAIEMIQPTMMPFKVFATWFLSIFLQ
jgi:hypothetical protein